MCILNLDKSISRSAIVYIGVNDILNFISQSKIDGNLQKI